MRENNLLEIAMNSLFLALARFGLAQDFLALSGSADRAGRAGSALSSCLESLALYTDIPRTWPSTHRRAGERDGDTQTEERELDILRHNVTRLALKKQAPTEHGSDTSSSK